jgi:AcrR family transcriptional regulator
MTRVKKRSARAKRTYRSPHRQRGAEATRQSLIASARRLFAQHGYSATTIEEIARAAKVSTPTFYATFGSKPVLLLALLDAMETEADVPRLEADLSAAGDPRRHIRSFVAFGVRLYARATDVLETIRAAGMAEKDLGALWREGEHRRRLAQRRLVKTWGQRGLLKPGLDARKATDIFWALTGPDSYRLFVRECRWSADRYTQWLTGALTDHLLREP